GGGRGREAREERGASTCAVSRAVPGGSLGALTAATLVGQANDVYFKVGLLTAIGLAVKNAILIVEFAKGRMESGMGL
ncbi:efflux RND transporter permease subunit, partial [Rhizobium ruizarguesonis]